MATALFYLCIYLGIPFLAYRLGRQLVSLRIRLAACATITGLAVYLYWPTVVYSDASSDLIALLAYAIIIVVPAVMFNCVFWLTALLSDRQRTRLAADAAAQSAASAPTPIG